MSFSTQPPQVPSQNAHLDVGKHALVAVVWYQFFTGLVVWLVKFTAAFNAANPGSTVVASLPSAASVGAGARNFVTDATATTFHSTVVGSGSNKVPVVSDGTNWLIG